MGWRFRKRIKIAPGIRLNLSRSGISATFGGKWGSVNVGKNGTYLNTGIRGTGLYRRDRISGSKSSYSRKNNYSKRSRINTYYTSSFKDNINDSDSKIIKFGNNWGCATFGCGIVLLFLIGWMALGAYWGIGVWSDNPEETKDAMLGYIFLAILMFMRPLILCLTRLFKKIFLVKKEDTSPVNSEEEVTNSKQINTQIDLEMENKNENPNYTTPSDVSCTDEVKEDTLFPYDPKKDLENYHYPTIDLLMNYDNDETANIDVDEQNNNKDRIANLLYSFGIKLSSIKATIGPRITFYEISLAPGMNVSKMKGLEDDLALALCSHHVRIIAPIPGKGTIGIEVPNTKPSTVSMESILTSKAFQETSMDLPCAIGKTQYNEVFMFDLAEAPHVLIAGSTGQGKSVILNAIITSLLYKKHPAELKLVLMEPYGIEFGVYSQIANSFLASLANESTIISKSSPAVGMLNSLCKEMEARYNLLKIAQSRTINEYNSKFLERQLDVTLGHRYLPYIVVVIDEYSVFIKENGQVLESPLVRLAEFARAVGIHLIISTKRPTSDIITGSIKANFPTRISFRVPERVDSQVILDCVGAENLIGNGDLLYKAGKSLDCIRVQGAFVDTEETQKIVSFISNQQSYSSPYYLPDPSNDSQEVERKFDGINRDKLDPLFEDAARLIVVHQQGSSFLIQRKFAIGYNRAGRIMDDLERAGIVGPSRGSSPRDVLIQDEIGLSEVFSRLFDDK